MKIDLSTFEKVCAENRYKYKKEYGAAVVKSKMEYNKHYKHWYLYMNLYTKVVGINFYKEYQKLESRELDLIVPEDLLKLYYQIRREQRSVNFDKRSEL